jgi:hypothetical protein
MNYAGCSRTDSLLRVERTQRVILEHNCTPQCGLCACHFDSTPCSYCGGTHRTIIDKLDYIQGMGFDAIWISPVGLNLENTNGKGESYHGLLPFGNYMVKLYLCTFQVTGQRIPLVLIRILATSPPYWHYRRLYMLEGCI